jgi:hypothetical protein
VLEPRESTRFFEELGGYSPEADRSKPITFPRLLREIKFATRESDPADVIIARMSDFASIGYCGFQGWHVGAGTEAIRPALAQKKVESGVKLHTERETSLRAIAEAAPIATRAQLRDPRVDIVDLPEFPGRIRVGGLTYASRLDSIARRSGNLEVTELKTGRYLGTPSHLLQVWGYCLSAPSAVVQIAGKDFRARSVSWRLVNPVLGEEQGPYVLRERALELVHRGMRLFELIRAAGAARQIESMPRFPGVFPAKCSPCAFSHGCHWSLAGPARSQKTLM